MVKKIIGKTDYPSLVNNSQVLRNRLPLIALASPREADKMVSSRGEEKSDMLESYL
jgi:hypothetical protein